MQSVDRVACQRLFLKGRRHLERTWLQNSANVRRLKRSRHEVSDGVQKSPFTWQDTGNGSRLLDGRANGRPVRGRQSTVAQDVRTCTFLLPSIESVKRGGCR